MITMGPYPRRGKILNTESKSSVNDSSVRSARRAGANREKVLEASLTALLTQEEIDLSEDDDDSGPEGEEGSTGTDFTYQNALEMDEEEGGTTVLPQIPNAFSLLQKKEKRGAKTYHSRFGRYGRTGFYTDHDHELREEWMRPWKDKDVPPVDKLCQRLQTSLDTLAEALGDAGEHLTALRQRIANRIAETDAEINKANEDPYGYQND
eukprot:TRINITY_DN5676_c0_g1_i2.p1 TRINITY_DN5676_c0_g1~~TRINITY_DN5676_c0_g1_i2.p1  ORF type:complete len:208 (+),score=30.95 TRINITY_DN5676_c0_g1_i2:107-730(+)